MNWIYEVVYPAVGVTLLVCLLFVLFQGGPQTLRQLFVKNKKQRRRRRKRHSSHQDE
ncbi:hypothetical protein [Deinococcus roseus]|uniref:Uncharacterized protein n=1 Tax=Deinococcus roseus TaxID=392414 RepID=A0ABQ2DDP3_9DEIO|nr:hypothetical protein [Deinococcus roseus]GGJ52333.1 hypothetical protein GCM10008938_42920 [Deinococcus roseus]